MIQWIHAITKPILLRRWWQDLILHFPRILCGFWLTVNFGSPKFGMPWSPPENNLKFFEVAFWFPTDVSAFGGPFALFPAFFAWMGAFSEAVGGVFWIVGFQTRANSFLIGCTMLVAALGQQYNNGLWFMLPALGIFWVSLYGMVLGSGRFGVDFLFTKTYKK